MNSAEVQIAGTKKPLVSGFLAKIGLFQTRHLLDCTLEFGIRAIGAGTFRRHGIQAGDGLGQQAIEAALMIGAVFPGCGVTDFWCTQQTGAVACIAVLGNHVIRCLRATAAARSHGNFHPFAFLALDTHLADRLQALGNLIIGRSLSADSP
jgi:hypothetical protein